MGISPYLSDQGPRSEADPAPGLSVVIPAHNEANVIERCLSSLRTTVGLHLEVVVICNGCTDDTAARARRAYPAATVLELDEAGKAIALNAGDAVATVFPRLYLDADVEMQPGSLESLVVALARPGVDCAAPRAQFDSHLSTWVVRRFYEAWLVLPYLNKSMVGSGAYAVSLAGRQRWERFPERLVADDQFVASHFSLRERLSVPDTSFIVHTPRDIRGLLAVRTRVYRGNRELSTSGFAPSMERRRRLAVIAAVRSVRVSAVGVYVAINALAELLSRHSRGGWERDESARQATAPTRDVRRVGYVTSRYPSVSHSFIQREVRAVREAGIDVRTFSVLRAAPEEVLSDADREEAAATWSVRPVAPPALLAAHLRTILAGPGSWSRVLLRSTRRAPCGMRSKIWALFYFAEAVHLVDECRRQGVRHLHAHHANVAADLAWIATELGQGLDGVGTWAWTLTFHGSSELFEIERHNLPAKLAAAARVMCVSDFSRAQLLGLCDPASWQKISVVHMGVDLQRYDQAPTSAADGSIGRVVRLLSVGRMDPVKGYPVLLDAVALLRERDIECELTIVGAGDGFSDLAESARRPSLAGHVRLLGAVGQDELPALYRDADIFCLASFTEALPVVLMEAMAVGLPVVATSIAGIPELVDSGNTGLLVPPARADLLANAIALLTRDPKRRDAMGKAGRQVIVERFDATACGKQAATILRSVDLLNG